LLEGYSLGLPFLGDRPYSPDGKVRTFAYQANHLYSACYYGGRMSCVDCHDPHGQGYRDVARMPLSGPYDDGQCLGCHASKAADPSRHTFHSPDSEGARCVSCHMPYRQHPGVGEHVPYGRSDHSISIPRPGVDEDLGAPSACALCHGDRTVEELTRQVEAWYGRLAPQPRLVQAVATARRAEGGRFPARLSPLDLVDPEEPNPLLQMAALNELFRSYVRPDLGSDTSGVAPEDEGLVDRLRRSASSGDLDVAATSLALLQLGWGEVPELRAFLDQRRAEERGPDSRVLIRWGRALQLMGDAWRSGGRGDWALGAFTRAQEVRPADPSILLDLASAYTGLGRFEESLPYYVEAVRLDPTLSVAYVNLGLTLENLGREDEAEGVYLRAVQVAPFEAVAHMNLGNISLRRGDAAAAAASYREALRHDPSMARAGYYLAVALVSLDDVEGAREALLHAREFAPDDPEIAQLLARLSAFIR
jgi:tetratricopeptide (TPR) repeat protein